MTPDGTHAAYALIRRVTLIASREWSSLMALYERNRPQGRI